MRKKISTSSLRTPERQAAGFDITGDNITFVYPDEPGEVPENDKKPRKPVLNDLSFHFEAGKLHAIVGDNGSGKTTLVHILSQLYDTYLGTIQVNSHDIKDYDLTDLRSRMSIMFQEPAKLKYFSVRENIGLGDTATLESDPGSIDAIATEHHITDFIELDTIIGNLHKQHKDPDEKWQVELSGGQWQKIALARAFMKAKTADLVILDEPTSALDVDAEVRFFKQLRTSRNGKTTIFITHKYITTTTADCIHFIRGGKIIERGSHAELMANAGEYARLYRMQTQGYLNPTDAAFLSSIVRKNSTRS